jgi:manganese/zinc/iron transport system substrate-binding protein
LKNFLFLIFFCALLVGCSTSRPRSAIEVFAEQNGKIKVLSTTAMIGDIVKQIGGDRIDAIALISGEIDPHSYELVKGDDEKISLAQLIFYNGLGLEHGASLRYQLMSHANAFSVGGAILEKWPQRIIYLDKEVDPHIWMDISLWSGIVEPIADALSKLDPAGSETYHQRGKVVLGKMQDAHKRIYDQLQSVPKNKRYLVTSHDAFNYFARAYLAAPEETLFSEWKKRFCAPEGLSPEGQLSAADIQAIIDHLIKYHIQTVFPESNVSRDSLKKVVHACKRKGLIVEISPFALYGDAMGPKGSDADTYLKMIGYDAHVLCEAWK